MTTKLVAALVLAFTTVACAQEGSPAVETAEWADALERARANGKLDDSCIDDGVTYVLVNETEWLQSDDPTLAGHTDGSVVYIRLDGLNGYSARFTATHEFLHAILKCSGEGDWENDLHLGHVWDGLRDGDKRW